MPVVLASKTLDLIDKMIYADQGAAFRGHLGKLIPESADAFEGQKDDFRSHLGGSMIGRECPRELWYNFHWAKAPKFEARMLRLFNRGHLEEARFVAMLMMIGATVYDKDGKGEQFKVSYYGGHFGSAIDAVIVGCPDVPDEPILGEFKTYNAKQFAKLIVDGVVKAKHDHHVQMQLYMGYHQLRKALYMAVCKDTDEVYAEIIDFDQAIYDTYVARGGKIIFADHIPARISENSGFWKCKYCSFHDICHVSAKVAVNCRTCAGAVPVADGTWQCIKFSVTIDKKQQLVGCQEYDKRIDFLS